MFCLLFVFILFASCKKDEINNDASFRLSFSDNPVLFDTVFTTIGSTTKHLIVHNTSSRKINISDIRLVGGSSSMFSININGTYTTSAGNIEIATNDSLFIFVKVSLNPNNINNPLVVNDSIHFITNGNSQYVKLIAWGQDAHFIVADHHVKGLPPYRIIAHENEHITWDNDKPYVVYGFAVVDSTGSLTINQGVKVHFYNNSGLWIYKGGSLKVAGTRQLPVTFTGTRLEKEYRDIPGQWDRIWLNEGSIDNEINYAVIQNAFIGIQSEILDINNYSGNQLKLTNTIIKNCSGFGLLARTYRIIAANVLVTNCGQYGIALTRGGNYDFRNCTLANFWDYSIRQTPSLVINNYFEDDNKVIHVFNLDNAFFGNCIIYGNISDEYLADSVKQGAFNYKFENCIIRTSLKVNSSAHYLNVVKNKDPLFNPEKNNYRPPEGSPADNAGKSEIIWNNPLSLILAYDISGLARPRINSHFKPDIGAYQTK